jgi:hypothetical protein
LTSAEEEEDITHSPTQVDISSRRKHEQPPRLTSAEEDIKSPKVDISRTLGNANSTLINL